LNLIFNNFPKDELLEIYQNNKIEFKCLICLIIPFYDNDINQTDFDNAMADLKYYHFAFITIISALNAHEYSSLKKGSFKSIYSFYCNIRNDILECLSFDLLLNILNLSDSVEKCQIIDKIFQKEMKALKDRPDKPNVFNFFNYYNYDYLFCEYFFK
jgi:hypothetical protein